MELRRLRVDEIEMAAEFAIAGLRPDRYPMHLDLDRVLSVAKAIVESPRDFHLAAFESGRLVGGVAAVVSPLPFWERCEAHVVMLRAERGVGLRLVRALRQWFMGNPMLRRLQWPMEDDADDRIKRLAAACGFGRTMSVAIAYKE